MYHATIAAVALHQVLLRTMTKALRGDNPTPSVVLELDQVESRCEAA